MKEDVKNQKDAPLAVNLQRGIKPPYNLCWICNRKFRGNHYDKRVIDGYMRWLHKTCARDNDRGMDIDWSAV
jgi:hypothetical protein